MKIKNFFKRLFGGRKSEGEQKTPFWRRVFKPKKERETSKGATPKVAPEAPKTETVYITEESPAEVLASAELQRIKDMIEEAQFGDFKPPAMIMILQSCEKLEDILTEAESRYTATEIMDRLKGVYGGSLEALTHMIDSIIFAVYNKNNSGFAKWAGRGAKARWEAEIKRIEGALA